MLWLLKQYHQAILLIAHIPVPGNTIIKCAIGLKLWNDKLAPQYILIKHAFSVVNLINLTLLYITVPTIIHFTNSDPERTGSTKDSRGNMVDSTRASFQLRAKATTNPMMSREILNERPLYPIPGRILSMSLR